MRKLPNPRSSTLSPFDNASVMLSKTVLTIVSVSFLVRFAIFETSSIRSALVIVRSRPDWGKTFAWNYLATKHGAWKNVNQRKELAATRTLVGPRCRVARRNAISHAVLGWARSKWWVELRVHIQQSLPLLTHQTVRTDSSDSWRSSSSVHQVERRLE